ncbi:MAG: bacteriocin family protein [Candidatus Omnitrophica bacterium]|jgi:hypothetical protein|nr:bacteriocin family protein [Candidatus Omnitrophota bacterium]
MLDVNVDLMGNGGGQGEIAAYMQQNNRLDPAVLRPYRGTDGKAYISVFKGGDPKKPENYSVINVNEATLRPYEWRQLDEAVITIAENRLVGVNDLISNGLTYNLGNAMGTTVLETHTISDAMEADLTMDAVSRAKGDRPVFGTKYTPIPIIHVDYEINARVLASSRSLGNPLDTSSAERAARKVAEKLEDMLFTNTTYGFGGGTIYSYINYPDRSLISLTTYGNWATSTTTGAKIIESVLAMKQASIDDNYFGPWKLYVPTNFETRLDNDYDTVTPGTTIRERILKIGGIQSVTVADHLPASNVLLVQMTSNVVRLIRGIGLTNVEWQTEGKFVNKYKVLTIQVPQIRSDYNEKTGIVHMS